MDDGWWIEHGRVGCDEAVGDGKSERCLMLAELELDTCWIGIHAHQRAAVKQVTWPPPRPIKAVESTTAPSPGTFEQYTLLDRLSDAAKAQTKPSDDAMIIDEPVKPVAGSSKHPDDTDIIDGELIY